MIIVHVTIIMNAQTIITQLHKKKLRGVSNPFYEVMAKLRPGGAI